MLSALNITRKDIRCGLDKLW